MNDNAKKWVAALRSGEYKQARGSLRNDRYNEIRFCCLGVACDLYAKNGGQGRWDGLVFATPRSPDDDYPREESAEESELPECVKEWLGLKHAAGRYDHPANFGHSLMHDNDGITTSAKTFSEIADIIESEPEGLFVK